jgi:hypothetical protein
MLDWMGSPPPEELRREGPRLIRFWLWCIVLGFPVAVILLVLL